MASDVIQPYPNYTGHSLNVFSPSGSAWDGTSNIIQPGEMLTLANDGLARNIWDNQLKIHLSSSNPFFSGGDDAWFIPSNGQSGGLGGVNVIIINNSNNTYVNPLNSGVIYPPMQTTIDNLFFGVFTLDATGGAPSTQSIQILPLPDQIVTIGSSGLVSVNSPVLSRIPTTSLSIHNCFTSMLFIRIRPCDGALAQNIGQIAPNQTIRLLVYSTYQIFLESRDGRIVSGFFDVPTSSVAQTIFFRTNGAVSHVSCSGAPIPPAPGPMPPTPPPVPPLPPIKTVQVAWNTETFPKNGTGRCIGDTISTVTTERTTS